jgi:hypothetical protein
LIVHEFCANKYTDARYRRNKMCLLKTRHDRRSSSVGDLLVHEMSGVDSRLTVMSLNDTCRYVKRIMLEGGVGQQVACQSDQRSIGHKICRRAASL